MPLAIDTDVLVLGSGIAGLSYAIKVASRARVTVLTKKEDSEANTNYAQGGIAAVMDPRDSFASHVADTLEAGAGLCDPEAVDRAARKAQADRVAAYGGREALIREGALVYTPPPGKPAEVREIG